MDRTELALRVDVLGPLSLTVQNQLVDVPGPRRRALLAVLALEAGRSVGTDRLVDTLWPDDPPDHAVQALYNHVSRLRGHLGPLADRLERQANGYRLRLEPGELDVDAARTLAATDPQAALALWRGPALAEFGSALEVEAVALAELRLQLVDDALEVRLTQGERNVAVDAKAAAAASPLREGTALLLVRALAAEARTPEAMEAAHDFRRRLVDETGLDPTPALAELEQLVASGEARPARSRVATPDGPMIGRRHDREEIVRLLGTNATVTVTGPGGVGKTRLVLDIASEQADAVVVGLATVERADRVAQAVASTLGLRTREGVQPADVAAPLADRQLLLVLDNCEHVVEACRELVTAVRRSAPGVRVLATSRVTLQVAGEYVVRLQPLPVPRDAHDLDAFRRQLGVRAFVEHARRRRPGYDVSAEDAADLVEVLRRLDGLPLGIELAARQVAVMPLREVRERLDRALDLATGREAAEDSRQRTLRATIDSSYRLLGEEEQTLLRAIAPFPGGVDLATVESLGSLDLLHALVDASLLVAQPETGRYRLLFTVRSFLVDELVARGEADEAHRRFVSRCRQIAEEIRARMFGPDEAATDLRLRAELANLRAARDLADPDDRVAITLAASHVVTWRDLREIWTWALELADDEGLAGHPQRALMLGYAAEAARLLGDLGRASRLAAESAALGGHFRHWNVQGSVAHFAGDFATACDAWLRASEEADDETSSLIGSAALAAAYGGELARARELLDRAHAVNQVEQCGSAIAFAAYVEGELRVTTKPDQSVRFYLAAIEEASRVGCTFVEGVARVSLGSALTRTGEHAKAAEVFAHLLESWRRTGQSTQLWTTARNAAGLLARVGSTETAAMLLLCADVAPGAAAVGPRIAQFSSRVYMPVEELVGPEKVAELRSETLRIGSGDVLDLAVEELVRLSTGAGRP